MKGVCKTVVSNYDKAVSHRPGVATHKTPPPHQASENPQLPGRVESLYEELLAKTLRNVMDVVGAVRGGKSLFFRCSS